MNGYKSPAEAAASIRAALKAKGYGPKDVSVTSKSYSMGSSVSVRIRDHHVPKSVIKEIARVEERIDYDERTGEILNGGNRFVSVSYDEDALVAVEAEYLPIVAPAWRQAEASGPQSSTIYPIDGTAYMVGRANTPAWAYSVWKRGESYGTHVALVDSARELARVVGLGGR